MTDIEKLIEYIKESNRIVFFGGAGVSTESGVPDFRSKDGLYNQRDVRFDDYEPEYLLSHDCLVNQPKVFFEFYRQKMDARKVSPNVTHKVLAKLEKMGKLFGIVTQNIDGLHQKAGSKRVYEVHGTTLDNFCSRCRKKYDENYIYDNKEEIPRCEVCGGVVRPRVTLYQESLPEDDVNGAINLIRNADLLIVGGTSLKVYPAAAFIYDFKGKHMVVINKEKLDVKLGEGDLMMNCGLGEVFSRIDEVDFETTEI